MTYAFANPPINLQIPVEFMDSPTRLPTRVESVSYPAVRWSVLDYIIQFQVYASVQSNLTFSKQLCRSYFIFLWSTQLLFFPFAFIDPPPATTSLDFCFYRLRTSLLPHATPPPPSPPLSSSSPRPSTFALLFSPTMSSSPPSLLPTSNAGNSSVTNC